MDTQWAFREAYVAFIFVPASCHSMCFAVMTRRVKSNRSKTSIAQKPLQVNGRGWAISQMTSSGRLSLMYFEGGSRFTTIATKLWILTTWSGLA